MGYYGYISLFRENRKHKLCVVIDESYELGTRTPDKNTTRHRHRNMKSPKNKK